jgi:hypothetical protein
LMLRVISVMGLLKQPLFITFTCGDRIGRNGTT